MQLLDVDAQVLLRLPSLIAKRCIQSEEEKNGRSRSLIEESKQVGAATLDQLRAQREQMNDIEKEIDVMDSNLTRAGKLVTSFAKRMATDKFIQGFSVLNICVLVGLIIYLAVTGKSLSPNQDDDGPRTATDLIGCTDPVHRSSL